DIFMTVFGIAAIVCVRAAVVGRKRTAWLIAAGVMGGASVASKIPGALFILLAIVLYLIWDRASSRGAKLRAAALYLGLVSVLVFAITHIGVIHGDAFALPWSEGSWLRVLVERQTDAISYHLNLDNPHTYQSPPWSWPLIRTPISFMSAAAGTVVIKEVLATGDPLVWWPALAALVWLTFHIRGVARPAAQVAVIGFGMLYLPWLVTGFGRPAYFFYFVPALPFLYIGAATAIEKLWHVAVTKHVLAVLVAAALVFFGFYYPVMTASQIPKTRWRALMLFEDCDRLKGVDPDSFEYRPLSRTGLKPSSGWCWI
ncbi:MAG: dolichyl-phosphate-mannose-protein mannosyltransferase, partial [Actinomycetota bacterium]|nr:dolichyl-phosphate-mannose-protein mannosyltransferase [Actinomycetota bacterium]